MKIEGRRWVLAARPDGTPKGSDFALQRFSVEDPGPGQVLVRILYHTVAPGVRARLARETYAAMVQIGEGIPGNGVGVVAASRADGFAEGDLVSGELFWATHALVNPAAITRLDPKIFSDLPPETSISLLGNAGLTAYFGLLRIGQAKKGDVVLVSSASGAVGSVVGQLARIKGCRVIGIAGSAEKCADLVDVLRFDDAVNYRAEPDLAAAIKMRAPEGVDIYFDNVGGEIADAAIANMKLFGRIVVCGQTSDYNRPTPRGLQGMTQVISRRLTLQGFIVHDFSKEFEAARGELASWLREGKLLHRPTIIDGIEGAVDAFVKQFEGGGGGRPLIRVG
ncbi:MAG: NADP-dependent oxidoreductase [Hyphomonadaceae bacterium]